MEVRLEGATIYFRLVAFTAKACKRAFDRNDAKSLPSFIESVEGTDPKKKHIAIKQKYVFSFSYEPVHIRIKRPNSSGLFGVLNTLYHLPSAVPLGPFSRMRNPIVERTNVCYVRNITILEEFCQEKN